MPTPPPAGLARAGSGVLGALLGIVLAAVGLVVLVGAMALGLVVVASSMLWSLLRGRRPAPVRFEWRRATERAWRPGSGRPASEEVVDVEVRELPDDRQHPGGDRT